jgi:hypothetical protein
MPAKAVSKAKRARAVPKPAAAPAPAGSSPTKLTLRAYNVGFGDCFLLTFAYPGFERRVLIDFGSTAAPKNADANYMLKIAQDIRQQCTEPDGTAKLHAVVVTHRHADHISGFAGTNETGRIIAALNPDVVIQPWTEDPNAAIDATTATAPSYTGGQPDAKAFVASLRNMNLTAAAIAAVSHSPHIGLGKKSADQLQFLGEDNLANKAAIENLMAMGRKTRATYVNCGSASGLEEVLPGVVTHVLGPPNLEQTNAIRKERSSDPGEFWQFHAFWQFQAAAGAAAVTGRRVFPNAPVFSEDDVPPNMRWFRLRARKIRGEQLMELVRDLDQAMNNTSVILLLEVGGMKLLFPGDAQIENWAYALGQPKLQALLKDVNLYKVGHHGSRNATPKTLWGLFDHKSEQEGPDRLTTVVSTKPGKHGSAQAHTEVPRRTLVAELEKESDYFSTQDLPKAEISKIYTFEFSRGRVRTAQA